MREDATEYAKPGGTQGGIKGWFWVVFGEALSTKTVKMGLFILIKQDVGLAKILVEGFGC